MSGFAAAGLAAAAAWSEPMMLYELSLSPLDDGPVPAAAFLSGSLIALIICGPAARLLGPARAETALLALIAGTLICAAAWSVTSFALGRIAQGLASALTALFAMGFVAIEQPADKRIGLLGAILLVMATGGFVGGLAGSVLAAELSWRWSFVALSPLGVASLALLRLSRQRADGARTDG